MPLVGLVRPPAILQWNLAVPLETPENRASLSTKTDGELSMGFSTIHKGREDSPRTLGRWGRQSNVLAWEVDFAISRPGGIIGGFGEGVGHGKRFLGVCGVVVVSCSVLGGRGRRMGSIDEHGRGQASLRGWAGQAKVAGWHFSQMQTQDGRPCGRSQGINMGANNASQSEQQARGNLYVRRP